MKGTSEAKKSCSAVTIYRSYRVADSAVHFNVVGSDLIRVLIDPNRSSLELKSQLSIADMDGDGQSGRPITLPVGHRPTGSPVTSEAKKSASYLILKFPNNIAKEDASR